MRARAPQTIHSTNITHTQTHTHVHCGERRGEARRGAADLRMCALSVFVCLAVCVLRPSRVCVCVHVRASALFINKTLLHWCGVNYVTKNFNTAQTRTQKKTRTPVWKYKSNAAMRRILVRVSRPWLSVSMCFCVCACGNRAHKSSARGIIYI